MTESQMKYIKYLDHNCMTRGLKVRADNDDLLGKDWDKTYKNVTLEYANEVISKMKTALGLPTEIRLGGRKK